MQKVLGCLLCLVFALMVWGDADAGEAAPANTSNRNVVIFVADGLRPGSVNVTDAPTMSWIRDGGVSFSNSHSVFPTFTTANASAIATGHYLGDTGDYSNTIYSGYPMFATGDFGKTAGTYTPFVEDDPVLGDLDLHYGGNYLNEETLLSTARKNGYAAAIGKLGPASIQDVEELNPVSGQFVAPRTVIIDDWTGADGGIPFYQQAGQELYLDRGCFETTAVGKEASACR